MIVKIIIDGPIGSQIIFLELFVYRRERASLFALRFTVSSVEEAIFPSLSFLDGLQLYHSTEAGENRCAVYLLLADR